MVLGQAGMFLSFQARRSSATRSSTFDLTVVRYSVTFQLFCFKLVKRRWRSVEARVEMGFSHMKK